MEEVHSTKIIPSFPPGMVKQFVEDLSLTIKTKKAKFVQNWPKPNSDGRLYSTGDNGNGYYYLEVDREIIYFVRYRKVRAGGNSFGRQVLVARLANRPESIKVAAHVFFELLLPRFGALMTDTQQTLEGQRFWSFVLGEAFERGLLVYAYDRRPSPNSLVLLESMKQLNSHLSVLWGSTEGHLRTHAVISSRELRLLPSKQT